MSHFHWGFAKFADRLRGAISLRSIPRPVAAALATMFLGLAVGSGIGITRDFHRETELRNSANQKRLLMLVGEVELGNAVQDFKDCLLRADSSYCDDCDQHIQVLNRTVSMYEAQSTTQPDEQKVLVTLKQALSDYGSAVVAVRDMQARHLSIAEIDAATKGPDRSIGAALRELTTRAERRPEWRLPLAQPLACTLCTLLGALFAYLSLTSSARAETRPSAGAPLLPQLSSRLFEWDEDRKTSAFLRLHEGVCQSLSGIMYALRSAQLAAAADVPESVIPSLQAVIQDTRAVAMQLRPPRMEDGGLLATLRSLWVDARSLNAELVIKSRVLVAEFDIPEGLKPVILRIARMVVEVAGQSADASLLTWDLERHDQMLRLSIEVFVAPDQSIPSTAAPSGFDAFQALIVLSGGGLERVRSAGARQSLVCSWPLVD